MRPLILALLVLVGCGGAARVAAPATPVPPVAAAPIPVPQWLWTNVGMAEHVAFTDDGRTLVVVSGEAGSVIDASTGQVRAWLPLEPHWVRRVTPSRDGHAVLTGEGAWSLDDGTARQVSGSVLGALLVALGITEWCDAEVLGGGQRIVVFAPEQTYLADATGHVLVRDLEPRGAGMDAPLDPSGRTFLVRREDHTLIVASDDGTVRGTIAGQTGLVAYTRDGARLLVGASDTLRSIDVATGAVLAEMDLGGGLFGLSSGAEWALVRRAERCVLVDGTTLAVAAEAVCPATTMYPALVSAAGTFVADPYQSPLELVDLRAGTSRTLADADARALAITPDGTRVLIRTDVMTLVDASAGPLWSRPRQASLPVRDVHVLEGHLFVSTDDRTWDVLVDGTTHDVACGFGDPHPAPRRSIVLECVEGSLVDAETGEVVIASTIALDRSDDGSVVVGLSDDGFDVFDLAGERTLEIEATSFEGGPVIWASHALSHDGSRIVIADVTSTRVMDAITGAVVAESPAHDDALVAFVEDDRRVLVAHVDGSVTLHESATLALVATLPAAPGTADLFGLDVPADRYTVGNLRVPPGASYVVIGGEGVHVVHLDGDTLRDGILLRDDETTWTTEAGGAVLEHMSADNQVLEMRTMPDVTPVAELPWLVMDDGTMLRCVDEGVRAPGVDRALARCDYMNVVPSADGRFVTQRSETVAHLSRVQTGERLWMSLVQTGDDVSLVVWDEAGHASAPEGFLLERDRDGLRAPEASNVVAAFLSDAAR